MLDSHFLFAIHIAQHVGNAGDRPLENQKIEKCDETRKLEEEDEKTALKKNK